VPPPIGPAKMPMTVDPAAGALVQNRDTNSAAGSQRIGTSLTDLFFVQRPSLGCLNLSIGGIAVFCLASGL
jgi:hypothetical protein